MDVKFTQSDVEGIECNFKIILYDKDKWYGVFFIEGEVSKADENGLIMVSFTSGRPAGSICQYIKDWIILQRKLVKSEGKA